MTTYVAKAGVNLALSNNEKRQLLEQALAKLNRPLNKVLIIPPDITRLNSNAGPLTRCSMTSSPPRLMLTSCLHSAPISP